MLSHILPSALVAAAMMSVASAQTQPTPTYHGPMNSITEEGCFSDNTPLQDMGPWTFQSSGNCQGICYGMNKPVMALANGSNCYCGDLLPASDKKTDDSNCNTPCQGYDKEMCGGNNYWRVMLTGVTKNQISNYNPSSTAASTTSTSSSQATSTSTKAAVVTVGGSTVVVTATDPTATQSSTTTSGSKPNVAGIAAGVVVGVVGLAGIIGGIYFFLRRRHQKSVEDEYKRQAAIHSFVEAGKPPGTSHSSLNDSRLDPVMVSRRQSDGSIMDNQDYSRRILKVANPDA